MSSETELLKELFNIAVAAAHPSNCLASYLPQPPAGKTVVVGAGKAAASMAQVTEQNWPSTLSGLVVTRYGHAVECERIEVWEAGHPVPDKTGEQAAKKMIDMVRPLGINDLVLALISGGGSALLTLPAHKISLEEKQSINRALLKSGANIYEMNCVRKHLSAIKGGQFVEYCTPASVTCLMISDVPGDDPSTIASGPTVGDKTTREQALSILGQYGIPITQSIRAHLESTRSETPKPDDPIFSNVSNIVIASAKDSLAAASAFARQRGLVTIILGDDLQGEARELGTAHAKLAMSQSHPVLLISGGEATVRVAGTGRGGRNVEYLLALAIELDGTPDIYAIAADTDGIDGSETNAGAVLTPSTLTRARAKNINPLDYLSNNDGYSFFAELGDLLITGPTLTNVNDFRAIYIAR